MRKNNCRGDGARGIPAVHLSGIGKGGGVRDQKNHKLRTTKRRMRGHGVRLIANPRKGAKVERLKNRGKATG